MRVLTTMEQGQLPSPRFEQELVPWLDRVSDQLGGAQMGLKWRLAAHTLELAIVRYALHTDEECLRITGLGTVEEAVGAIEDHLAALAARLFSTEGDLDRAHV